MERNLFNNMVAEVRVDLYPKMKVKDMFQVGNSNDAYELLRSGWPEINYRESFQVLFLNRANKAVGIKEISKGGISGTVIDVRMILQAALGCSSSSIILAHNHPSGTMVPSEADRKITRKIKEAANLMDITTLDHLILSDETYYSFADEGIL
mgnify:CR=1 FL=1